jgi:hypothetical protein
MVSDFDVSGNITLLLYTIHLSGNFGDQYLEHRGHMSSITQFISEFVHNLFSILCKKKKDKNNIGKGEIILKFLNNSYKRLYP